MKSLSFALLATLLVSTFSSLLTPFVSADETEKYQLHYIR